MDVDADGTRMADGSPLVPANTDGEREEKEPSPTPVISKHPDEEVTETGDIGGATEKPDGTSADDQKQTDANINELQDSNVDRDSRGTDALADVCPSETQPVRQQSPAEETSGAEIEGDADDTKGRIQDAHLSTPLRCNAEAGDPVGPESSGAADGHSVVLEDPENSPPVVIETTGEACAKAIERDAENTERAKKTCCPESISSPSFRGWGQASIPRWRHCMLTLRCLQIAASEQLDSHQSRTRATTLDDAPAVIEIDASEVSEGSPDRPLAPQRKRPIVRPPGQRHEVKRAVRPRPQEWPREPPGGRFRAPPPVLPAPPPAVSRRPTGPSARVFRGRGGPPPPQRYRSPSPAHIQHPRGAEGRGRLKDDPPVPHRRSPTPPSPPNRRWVPNNDGYAASSSRRPRSPTPPPIPSRRREDLDARAPAGPPVRRPRSPVLDMLERHSVEEAPPAPRPPKRPRTPDGPPPPRRTNSVAVENDSEGPSADQTDTIRVDGLTPEYVESALQDVLADFGEVLSFWLSPASDTCYAQYASAAVATATRRRLGRHRPVGGRPLRVTFAEPATLRRLLDAQAAPVKPLAADPRPPAPGRREELLRRAGLRRPPPTPPTPDTPTPSTPHSNDEPPTPHRRPPKQIDENSPKRITAAPHASDRKRLRSPDGPNSRGDGMTRGDPQKPAGLQDLFMQTKARPRLYFLPNSSEEAARHRAHAVEVLRKSESAEPPKSRAKPRR